MHPKPKKKHKNMPYLTTRKNLNLQLSPGLVASYDIQPGNGVGLFWDTTHTPDLHGGGGVTRWTDSMDFLTISQFYILLL